ncbi:MAG TPA: FeoB-associated Cys-rich membrane protein [Lactobacillus sp.]|nr:FeoB-associated Cys-rich membrane protein [Lactobacillus sp.]
MALLINISILVLLIIGAVIIIIRTVHQSSKPHCESCEYACEAKRMMKHRGPAK